VTHLIAVFHVSERFACRVVRVARSAYRRQPVDATPADPDAWLRDWLRVYAKAHPRWGYRRAHADLRKEGARVNHKKVQRLWRQEGLKVPVKRHRKRVGVSTAVLPAADAPNKVWAVDFQFDSDENGKKIKIANLVDEHTRECLACLVERAIPAPALTRMLDQVVAQRGYPQAIRADNGPEFASQALAAWADGHAGLVFIPPGTPWNNGCVESFNSRLRDECLNVNSFWNLRHARAIIAFWRDEYNTTRPHSALGYLTPVAYATLETTKDTDESHT